jgi:hypothetical protein
MQEFATVSASSIDPAALAAKLTEKSAEGWSIVSIVSTAGDVTAFISRATGAAEPAAAEPAVEAAPAAQPEPAAAPVATENPGWAVAPEPAAPMAPIADPTPAPSYQAAPVSSYQPAPAPSYQPAPAAAPAAAPATAAIPANWYADPAGRFEMRYWDGGKWTEHVSRGGQQFTDPPVG